MLSRDDVATAATPDGHIFIAVTPVTPVTPGLDFAAHLAWYRDHLGAPLYLAATHYHRGDDDHRLARLASLSESHGVPLVATGDIHQHDPARRRLHDVLTCIREHCTIDNAGWRLHANAERHLKPPAEVARLFRDHPSALANTVEIAERCRFSLGELRYEYPDEVSGDGRTPQETLETLTWAGAAERYPAGIPPKVRATIEHELALIGQLEYEPYFLTVEDIVRKARDTRTSFARGAARPPTPPCATAWASRRSTPTGSTCSSSASSPPSATRCPTSTSTSSTSAAKRSSSTSMRKYGRDRAGLTATVISYRVKSALRDTGKAMGLSEDVIGRLLSVVSWWSKPVGEDRAREEGFDPEDRRLALTMELARELYGFPRHLSQHTGGFVISRGPLCEIVPIENAAMEDRTVIEWNKDDLEALGLIKVDVLGLGMLSCIRRAFGLIEKHHDVMYTLENVPREDPAVYAMIQRADTVGVFQIESRAQMAMLPRLKPATFYDLVIEVAIVRPGPIQGDMVHPYLRRRQGREAVEYPSEELRQVLEKTLGVPLFQEQVMRIAIVAAGFTPAEADQLRRAMASFRNPGDDPQLPGQVHRGHDRPRLRTRLRRTLLPPDRGLRRIRLSREPRSQLRPPRLHLVVAEVPLPGGLRLRAPEQPADGLLRAGADREGRTRSWRRGAADRRESLGLGLHAGGGWGRGRTRAQRPLRPAAGLPPHPGPERGRRRPRDGQAGRAAIARRRSCGSGPAFRHPS